MRTGRLITVIFLAVSLVGLVGCATINDTLTDAEKQTEQAQQKYNEEVRTEVINTMNYVEDEYTSTRERVIRYFELYCGDLQANINACRPGVGNGLQDMFYKKIQNDTDAFTEPELERIREVDRKVRRLKIKMQAKDRQLRSDWKQLKAELKAKDQTIREYFDKVLTMIQDKKELNQEMMVTIEGIQEVVEVYVQSI